MPEMFPKRNGIKMKTVKTEGSGENSFPADKE